MVVREGGALEQWPVVRLSAQYLEGGGGKWGVLSCGGLGARSTWRVR